MIILIKYKRIPEKNYPSIDCYSIENSPIKPNELIKIEEEQSILKADKNKVQVWYHFFQV